MKKRILITLSVLSLLFFFTGCFNPIFSEIKQDVAPEEGTITGIIRSLSRYTVNGKEFLVTVTKQGIVYKPVDAYNVDIADQKYAKHGNWQIFNKNPENFEFLHYDYYGTENFVGQQMLKAVTDSEYLYLVTSEYTNKSDNGITTPSKMHLYATKIAGLKDEKTWDEEGSNWTEVLLKNSDGSDAVFLPLFDHDSNRYSAFNVFSTNSVQTAHRKAYVRCGGSSIVNDMSDSKLKKFKEELLENYNIDYTIPYYYEISGTELKPITVENFDKDNALNYGCNTAVWYKGEIKFFNSIAAETNETYEKDATIIYFGNKNKESKKEELCYFDGTNFVKALETGSNQVSVSALAVCADSLIIGRASFNANSVSGSGGIAKTTLSEEGIPGTEFVSFTTNAEIKLKTAYFILTLLNEDPGKTEENSNLFASASFIGTGASSSASYENIGLWSYYPSRGNWNRE